MDGNDAVPALVSAGKWKRRFAAGLGSLAVIAACVAIRAIGGRENASAETPAAPKSAAGNATSSAQNSAGTSSQQPMVATVNGEDIHRQELAQECLARYGKDVLDTLVNKTLILSHCEKQGIKITKSDVEDEIRRLAKMNSIPVDQWLNYLKEQRGIKPEQYESDIILPMLALRKLAASRIQPTEQEINEAYEAGFGEAVDARMIVLANLEKAKQVLAKAKAKPDDFGLLSRENSFDPNIASLDGRIQPIRRFLGDPEIERVAFQLQKGEVSQIIPVKNQFVILKCEGRIPSSDVGKDKVRDRLVEVVRERKLRTVSGDLFKKLQETSQIVNTYTDPAQKAQMPGVAAMVNGKAITFADLANACIDRHGEDVLEMMIHRKLLEQELKRRSLTVTQKDLDAEIARAALSAGQTKKDGSPNIEVWLKMVADEGINREKYIHDAVWPSTALKLIAGDVKVTDDDIERGFRANYGPKAEVRVIVCDSQRHAQDVWQKARSKPTLEYFGKLAEEYSIEPSSKANQGRVPPIQQYGGQPELQKEVFERLKPGEISGIIQMSDKFVFVYLEGFTKPIDVSRDEARKFIWQDVHEKKQRLGMAKEFDRIKDDARIINYLTGSSQLPQKKVAAAGSRQLPGPAGKPDAVLPAGFESSGLLPRTAPANTPAPPSSAPSNSAPNGASRSGSMPVSPPR